MVNQEFYFLQVLGRPFAFTSDMMILVIIGVRAVQTCGDHAVKALTPALTTGREDDINLKGVSIMGKYVLGWILGVPAVVLVIIYLIFN